MTFYPHCPDCEAELQETPAGLRCPWFKGDPRFVEGPILRCGKPKGRITLGLDTSKARYR